MSESFIRNLRLAGLVIFVAGIFMTNTWTLFIGQFALIISLFIPYMRLEKLYFAMMNKPELKEKIESLMREDLEKRLGVNKDDETDESTKEE